MDQFKIFDFPDNTSWLQGRMNGIGGSDASAIVGLNPYKSNIDLFEEKIGRNFGRYLGQALRDLWKVGRGSNQGAV